MDGDVLVRAEGVSKKFCRSLKRSLWYGVQDVTSELLGRKGSHDSLRRNEFWAVDDVSFELRRGECLGLIGPNGAGKSTLLKLLNGLVKPDKGRITMRGRVGALIELGAGFNPILTARENIYVNASVLGFSRAEAERRFDAIVEFAEIGDFIDTPVQNFSSGMKVRLGFSVASQMQPDVLLVDEVLAVGDASFRLKCLNQLHSIASKCAMIVVSHSMPMISRVSSNALVLANGRSAYLGNRVSLAIERYLSEVKLESVEHEVSNYFELIELRFGSEAVAREGYDHKVRFADPFEGQMIFRAKKQAPDFYVNVAFIDMEGKPVAQCFSTFGRYKFNSHQSVVTISFCVESLLLNPGRYILQIGMVEALSEDRRGEILYVKRFAGSIHVTGELTAWAPVQLLANWQID